MQELTQTMLFRVDPGSNPYADAQPIISPGWSERRAVRLIQTQWKAIPVELKEFIRETLAQIAAGVDAAQTEVRDAGGFVNPAHRTGKQEQDKSHFGSLTSGQNIFLVDFDVTVTVVEATETEGKAKLNVAGFINLGTGGQSNASSTATNRISFKVPLAMPVDTVSLEELQKQDQIIAERRRRDSEQIRSRNQRSSSSW